MFEYSFITAYLINIDTTFFSSEKKILSLKFVFRLIFIRNAVSRKGY